MSKRFLPLTQKEIQILRLMAEGFSDSEIAELTGVTHNTIKTRAKVIYSKLGARNRVNAVYIALGEGVYLG